MLLLISSFWSFRLIRASNSFLIDVHALILIVLNRYARISASTNPLFC